MSVNHEAASLSKLKRIAKRAMQSRGLLPEFSSDALKELATIKGPAQIQKDAKDLRSLLWCSIDNDDSRDLDQLTVAEELPGGAARALVAIADVDALVKKGAPIDAYASHNTCSIYTAAGIFPMLPERLSTDLTSLGFEADRMAIVVDMKIAQDGELKGSEIYRALVRNKAKLAYDGVAAWLDGKAPIPEDVAAVKGLEENIRLQDRIAQGLKKLRHTQGALDLETTEARPVFDKGVLKDMAAESTNRAKTIIEDFMIAANGVTARFLAAKGLPSLRRIVRTPKRWSRIVEIAGEMDFRLPQEPSSIELEKFLLVAKKTDPANFPDLCLSVIKLLGAGEYSIEMPGEEPVGHFGLAVRDYTHSTAPNRRFPDLLTQRLVKASIATGRQPYKPEELHELARRCTEMEDAAKKVERQVNKSAAAMLLEKRIGEQFDSIVTGAADKGTWVRLEHPLVEGRLAEGYEGLDVGQRVKVRLVHVDVDRGFIDFRRA